MTDLDKLIAAVEAGTATKYSVFNKYDHTWDAMKFHSRDASLAYEGSLDAALRLHEALLPGWDFSVRNDGASVLHHVERDEPKYRGLWCDKSELGSGLTPARAWLLAVLKAIKAKGDA